MQPPEKPLGFQSMRSVTAEIRGLAKKALSDPKCIERVQRPLRKAFGSLPRDIKQADIANDLAVSESVISRALSGRQKFSLGLLRKIADWSA